MLRGRGFFAVALAVAAAATPAGADAARGWALAGALSVAAAAPAGDRLFADWEARVYGREKSAAQRPRRTEAAVTLRETRFCETPAALAKLVTIADWTLAV